VTKLVGPSYRAFILLICAAFALLWFAPREAGAETPCGGLNQRACCWLERNGGACNGGLVERGPCVGDCRCAHSLVSSSGMCRLTDIKPCGGEGQRACCVLERSGGACDAGLEERGPCSGDCRCANSLVSSSGTCRRPPPPPVIAPCGGEGQRACCAGERPQGSCNPDFEERPGCAGNCRCGNNALSSSGTCRRIDIAPCGGEGQRACCLGERAQGACDGGLTELGGCVGNCRCARSLVSSSGTCRHITSCGKEGERACCKLERATACDPGSVEAVSGQMYASNLSCDLRARGDLIKSGNTWQCDCAAGGASLGVCLRSRFDPTATCWFQSPPPPPTSPQARPAMSLYVAGFNHSRADTSTSVHREGVAELVKAISDSAEDPRSIVVAFSESLRDDLLSGSLRSCEAGTKLGPDHIPYTGQCVAYGLEQHFRAGAPVTSTFTFNTWHWWDALGGPALITGSRWKQIATTNLDTGLGRAFEVRLQDTRNPRTTVSIYMFHTSGDTAKDKDHPKDVLGSWQETEAIIKLARQRARPGDLAPLFVGDFNAGIGSLSGPSLAAGLSWLNQGNVCPAQPGLTAAHTFSLEQQIVHIFGGKRGTADPSIDFGCTSGHLAPVNLKYSRVASGEPTSLNDGIWLPDVAHNVVALGLEVASEKPERCSSPSSHGACAAACGDTATTCAESCSGPSAAACANQCRARRAACVAHCTN
jgi:hypothetical protein